MLESLFNKVAGLKSCIFIKKETPTQLFSCEYCEIFKNSFFYRTLVHYTFPKFYAMIQLLGHKIKSLDIKLTFFIFLVPLLCFLSYLIRIRSPWLLRTCFHTKIFFKCNFSTHYKVDSNTILTESLKFRNSSRITVTSYKRSLGGMSKYNPTQKQIDAETEASLKHAPA